MAGIVGYTYRAENLCGVCVMHRMSNSEPIEGANVESVLSFVAGIIGVSRTDESTFSFWDFPKVLTDQHVDSLSHCNNCGANFLEEGPNRLVVTL